VRVGGVPARGAGGKSYDPLRDEQAVAGEGGADVVMPAAPEPAFVVVEADFALEFFIQNTPCALTHVPYVARATL
jgi:hypothetical protein